MDEEKNKWENSINNPCWVAFIHPMTFVVPDDETPWEVKLDDINNVTYNNGNLIRIVTKFTIDKSNLCGLICYDGAIAIPKNKRFQTRESALNYFSLFFAKLLLSNFYVEGIDHRDIVNGILHDNWCIYPTDLGNSSISNLHSKIRMLEASNMDTIQLDNPRIVYVNELMEKLKLGEQILQEIPNLNPKFFVRGLTEFKYKNWDLVLSNLWITIEQLIDFIWTNKFLKKAEHHPNAEIPNRKKSLKEDNRTWSASVKQEILYQTKYIDEKTLNQLSKTRKIRNKLVHEGISVDEQTAKDILDVTNSLMKSIVTTTTFDKLNFRDIKISKQPDYNFTPNFKAWKELPESDFVEIVYGKEITAKAKKQFIPDNI